jgi:hypothetical protein
LSSICSADHGTWHDDFAFDGFYQDRFRIQMAQVIVDARPEILEEGIDRTPWQGTCAPVEAAWRAGNVMLANWLASQQGRRARREYMVAAGPGQPEAEHSSRKRGQFPGGSSGGKRAARCRRR